MLFLWDSRRNAIRPRDLPLIIHIDLAEHDLPGLALGGGELLEDGAYLLAWAAPVGIEVDDCVGGGGCGGFEVGV